MFVCACAYVCVSLSLQRPAASISGPEAQQLRGCELHHTATGLLDQARPDRGHRGECGSAHSPSPPLLVPDGGSALLCSPPRAPAALSSSAAWRSSRTPTSASRRSSAWPFTTSRTAPRARCASASCSSLSPLSQGGPSEGDSSAHTLPLSVADVHAGFGPFPRQGTPSGEEPPTAAGAQVVPTHKHTYTHTRTRQ